MIGELDISGVFLPTLLVMMFGTYLVFLGVHAVLVRLHFYRLVWHRACSTLLCMPCCLARWTTFAET